jgi:hypothetical protein
MLIYGENITAKGKKKTGWFISEVREKLIWNEN